MIAGLANRRMGSAPAKGVSKETQEVLGPPTAGRWSGGFLSVRRGVGPVVEGGC